MDKSFSNAFNLLNQFNIRIVGGARENENTADARRPGMHAHCCQTDCSLATLCVYVAVSSLLLSSRRHTEERIRHKMLQHAFGCTFYTVCIHEQYPAF